MDCLKAGAAALFVFLPLVPMQASADGGAELLKGRWVGIWDDGSPRTVLEFSGRSVRFSDLLGASGETEYEILPGRTPVPGELRIAVSFITKERRGNGRVIERRNAVELFRHEQDMGGRSVPFLSEMVFECDGRGEVVFSEYVREDDALSIPARFASDLKLQRNSVRPAPTVMRAGGDGRSPE